MQKSLIGVFFLISVYAFGQQPTQLNSSEIYQKMLKLNVLGNVLYLAAHPDDENTRFISYCANEMLFNTAYLSLTRGDGGQNLIGTEIREELGIIRTQELLAARRIDGGEQFFSRANDFGYSKNPEETLEIWNKDDVLADVVYIIRKFQPDVIVCRFPDDGRGGHGHHTSSAILAQEAFDISNDTSKYPEQLKFVNVWQPTRVVTNTGRWWNNKISDTEEGVISHDIGLYNKTLGMSYNEMASRSRTMHKSQGFGATGSRGSHKEFFEHVKGVRADKSLFDGIETSWSRVNNGESISQLTDKLLTTYDVSDLSVSTNQLLVIRKAINQLEESNWKSIKLKEISELISACLGVYIEAVADEFSKTKGDSLRVKFEVINRSNIAVDLIQLSSSKLSFIDNNNVTLTSNKKYQPELGFVLPGLAISQPYWLRKEGSLGMYKVDDQRLIGAPQNEPSISFIAKLSVNGEIIDYSFPLIYKWNDPVKGELYRPFVITPKVTANVEQPIYLFSSQEAQQVILILKSHTTNQSGKIKIIAPEGWSVEYDESYQLLNKGDEVKKVVLLKPLENRRNGKLKIYINEDKSMGLNTIRYDHFPPQVWFPKSTAKIVYVAIKKRGTKVGYIQGTGDLIPNALTNIGYLVDILKEEDLELSNLQQYDAILTGIRFFNVNERASFMMPKLMDYVEGGGNLIVQYNTNHRMKTKKIGPYPIQLSRDRVTEEKAEIVFLKPKHPVLNVPNVITKKDFDGWVQERGLYFPNEWDDRYNAVLSWHDKNEDDKKGSLLVAKYGKGNYVYTGISFFRELPAGVPGAYRLLVNIISLENE